MTVFTPSRDPGDAERTFATLVRSSLNPLLFTDHIRRLRRLSSVYEAGCPPPWGSRNLHITPEITYQSELWLPLAELRPHFYSLYRRALTYPPVLSNTPFASAVSWIGIVSRFPPFLSQFANPAVLFEELLADADLRKKFLLWSFMPERFYGDGSDRYPGQAVVIGDWLRLREGRGGCVRCLDAACGDGAAAYGLARLLLELGWHPDRFEIEGWTLDPLEVWAAAHGAFPHSPKREALFRAWVAPVFQARAHSSMLFRDADLRCLLDEKVPCKKYRFDLIVCNGLLGGPIIGRLEDVRRIASGLSRMLAPDGLLLVADHFHGGWKQKCPQQKLRALFERNNLKPVEAAEGIAFTRPVTVSD